MIWLLADTYANTIAGALAPAISLLAVGVATLAVRKIDRHHNETAAKVEQVKADTINTVERTENTIRGDLKNGLNRRLGSIERGVESIGAAQDEIKRRLDELEHHPPSHLG